MRFFQYLCGLIVLIQLSEQAATKPRIINGRKAQIKQHPHQIALFLNVRGNYFHFACGGSIISKQYILTAGHCVTLPKSLAYLGPGITITEVGKKPYIKLPPQIFKVMVGKSKNIYIKEAAFNVDEINVFQTFKHINYVDPFNRTNVIEKELEDDIALIKLTTSLTWSTVVKKISLPKIGEEYSCWGKTAVASGYGDTYNNPNNTDLYAIKLELPLPNESCKSRYRNQICVPVHERGTCRGDSGGPLVINKVLYGVTSKGVLPSGKLNCEDAHIHLFTSVISYRKWISENSDVDNEIDDSKHSSENPEENIGCSVDDNETMD